MHRSGNYKNEIEFYYRGTNLSRRFNHHLCEIKRELKPKGMIEKIQNELIEKKKCPNLVK